MPKPGLPLTRTLSLILLAALAAPAATLGPSLAKYPLRVHVLISNSGWHAPTLVSSGSTTAPDFDSGGGGGSDTSGNDTFPDMPPEYYGTGFADLVTPPTVTQGLRFTYDHCDSRVHSNTGFQSLPARWKKQGKQLEVLVPTDEVPGKHRAHPYNKCIFNVTVQSGVYLMMRNNKLVQVSQQDYAKKPALRAYITVPKQVLEPRQAAAPATNAPAATKTSATTK